MKKVEIIAKLRETANKIMEGLNIDPAAYKMGDGADFTNWLIVKRDNENCKYTLNFINWVATTKDWQLKARTNEELLSNLSSLEKTLDDLNTFKAEKEAAVDADQVVYEMMLEDGAELLEGEIVEVVEEYTPDCGGPGYNIVKVAAPSLKDIVKLNDAGEYCVADAVEDGLIVQWQAMTKAEYYLLEKITYTMDLEEGSVVIIGDVVETVEKHPCYSVVKVEVDRKARIVKKDHEGKYFQAIGVSNRRVIDWVEVPDLYYYQLIPESDQYLGGKWACCGMVHANKQSRDFYLEYNTMHDTRWRHKKAPYNMTVVIVAGFRGNVAGRECLGTEYKDITPEDILFRYERKGF